MTKAKKVGDSVTTGNTFISLTALLKSGVWIQPTGKELDYIEATTHKTILTKINELEWVDGKIYANTYQFQKEVG